MKGISTQPKFKLAAKLGKVFLILVSFRLSFIWLRPVFILSLNTKVKIKKTFLEISKIETFDNLIESGFLDYKCGCIECVYAEEND